MNSAAGGATMVDPLHDAWNKDAAKEFAEVEIEGVCLVFLRGDRIYRNEVYFDRTKLLATMKAH
jgi:hypothetical protein